MRIAYGLERRLFDQGHFPYVWDLASVESADRGPVARAFCEAGLLTICFADEDDAAVLETAVSSSCWLSVQVDRKPSVGSPREIFLQTEGLSLDQVVNDLLGTLRERGVLLGDD